jgi:sulfite exporter TauE/SafE
MEIIWTGLVLGLMGSFHCAGMCGPIALSLPLRGNNTFQKVFGGVLYNLGRTVT